MSRNQSETSQSVHYITDRSCIRRNPKGSQVINNEAVSHSPTTVYNPSNKSFYRFPFFFFVLFDCSSILFDIYKWGLRGVAEKRLGTRRLWIWLPLRAINYFIFSSSGKKKHDLSLSCNISEIRRKVENEVSQRDHS